MKNIPEIRRNKQEIYQNNVSCAYDNYFFPLLIPI